MESGQRHSIRHRDFKDVPVIDRRRFVALTGCFAAGLSPAERAHGQAAMRRIGFLSAFSRASVDAFLAQLRPELEGLGWTDGRNIVVLEPRTAEGANERLPSLAAELVAQSPDLLLVQTSPATRALALATKSIPIVMIGVGAPVELGIVADYKKPGGNVTGSSYLADELARKLLQFLKEAAPRLRSVAVFVNPSNESTAPLIRQTRADALALGLQAQIVEVSSKGDFEPAFAAIRRANTESILLPPEPLIQVNREAIATFANAHGLPLVVVGSRGGLPSTGLFGYGPASLEYAKATARYVDRIFRGARPADLPVEQPTRFSLVINLKVATALGLTIPQAMLLRADEVIR